MVVYDVLLGYTVSECLLSIESTVTVELEYYLCHTITVVVTTTSATVVNDSLVGD